MVSYKFLFWNQLEENAMVQEGIRVDCSPSLRLLPRFMGPKTHSLSLSTKLINSLRAQPDKLLINWLHCRPSLLSAAAGQSLWPHPRSGILFSSFSDGVPAGPQVLCSLEVPIHSHPRSPCSFLKSLSKGDEVGWSEWLPAFTPSTPTLNQEPCLPLVPASHHHHPRGGKRVPRGR